MRLGDLVRVSTNVRGEFLQGVCRRLAGIQPDILIESRAYSNLLALAEAGHGVAVIPSVVLTHRYALRVLPIPHKDNSIREPLAVTWERRRMLPKYAQDFSEMLATHMRDLFQTARGRYGSSGKHRGGTRRFHAAFARTAAGGETSDNRMSRPCSRPANSGSRAHALAGVLGSTQMWCRRGRTCLWTAEEAFTDGKRDSVPHPRANRVLVGSICDSA